MARRLNTNLSFVDLLFNVLIGFVMLFVIAFLLINPISKKADIPNKAEFVITLEWTKTLPDDVDLWIQRDDDKPVGFSNREGTPLHLDRDDLGHLNDKIIIDGRTVIVQSNRETATIRGIVSGNYYIAIHAYTKRTVPPIDYTVTVLKVNPFREVYSLSGTLINKRQVKRLPAFTVDKEGNVTEIFQHFKKVVPMDGAVQ